jgi:hypothetical protein
MVKALETTEVMLTINKYVFVIWKQKRHRSFEIKALRVGGQLEFSSSGDIFSTVPKLIVGSTVSVYVINAITNVNQPIIVFHLLKLNGALFMY